MRFLLGLILMVLGDVVRAASADVLLDARTEAVLMTDTNGNGSLVLSSPSGDSWHFELVPTEVISPELSEHFPAIQTWQGSCREEPRWSVRCDRSPYGLFAQIFTPERTVYLDWPEGSPSQLRNAASALTQSFRCLVESNQSVRPKGAATFAAPAAAEYTEMRTFRLAVAAAGEYTQFHGGTTEAALAAIVTVINRVNGIYERDLGIRLMLVEGTRNVIFTDPNTDPFTSNAPNTTTTDQAQQTLDLLVGSANYDVGIVFNTGTYGLAYLGSVCDPQRKGSACMGLPSPVGERFAIYTAHEMAHQFGANHSFNSNQGNCGPNRNGDAAVEPGTGSTLLSYAGLECANDSLQPLMDDYLHAWSIMEVKQFLQAVSCGQITSTSNRRPSISTAPNVIVPKGTPFQLSASGSDPDGDALLWTWEQMDVGAPKSLSDPDNGSGPLFRSFYPSSNSTRVFPRWEALLGNGASPGEQLPTTDRQLHFRVTARDSRNNGAMTSADTHVQVIGTAGPFRLTSHNSGGMFSGAQTVTWDVAGTSGSPIFAAAVNILLSTNGGATFAVLLATNTPNDGNHSLTFPPVSVANARLKLEAVGHVFFDVNDAPFSIGTVPPRFTSVLLTNGNVRLRWAFTSGRSYTVQAMENLGSPWQDLQVSTTVQGNEMEALVPASSPRRFFRVREF